MIIQAEEYQPYFQAWIDSHNYKVGQEVKMWEFQIWICEKWAEFKREIGTKVLTDGVHKQFYEWLTAPLKEEQMDLFELL